MMHSQGYTLFDKVNLFDIWSQEFAISQPKKSEIAAYFEISETEARRLKVVARSTKRSLRRSSKQEKGGDEVNPAIANQPPEQHRDAYERFGDLTVAAAAAPQARKTRRPPRSRSSGRPRSYVLGIRNEESGIAYISTTMTAKEWSRRGA
ncbi:MAG: hypothetical protein U1D30_06720 [Planctomycetota bacterium]